jgi:hypothetical protein
MTEFYAGTSASGSAFGDSQYGTAAATTAIMSLVNQVVDKKFHRQVQKKNIFAQKGLIGPDAYAEGDSSGTVAGYPIVRKTQLQSESGDVIKMGQLRTLVSDHKTGGKVLNANLIEHEKTFNFLNLKVSIERWREGVLTFAGMNRQRNPYGESLEAIEERLLSDWGGDKQDTSILYALHCGWSPHELRAYGTTKCPPSANANLLVGNSLTASRTVADLVADGSHNVCAETFEVGATFMEESDIDPVVVGGDKMYCSLISPRAAMYLLKDDRFRNAFLYARERSADNPLFKHAEFVYNNVIIFKYDKIRTILSYFNPAGLTVASNEITEASYSGIGGGVQAADLHQTIFLGANAVALAEGPIKMGARTEDDYGNVIGRDIDMIFGARRADWGTETDATSITNQSSMIMLNTLIA